MSRSSTPPPRAIVARGAPLRQITHPLPSGPIQTSRVCGTDAKSAGMVTYARTAVVDRV